MTESVQQDAELDSLVRDILDVLVSAEDAADPRVLVAGIVGLSFALVGVLGVRLERRFKHRAKVLHLKLVPDPDKGER